MTCVSKVRTLRSIAMKEVIMNSSYRSTAELQEQTVKDIKAVIADAEEMLSATADQAGEKIASLRARVQLRLQDAKVRLSQAEMLVLEKTKAAAKATDTYVHESPWTAVGIAAGVGFLIGVVLGRR
jgi:ElaB/YqjD/DUF883 family membrane-anchored ribosome-binding protein